MSQFLCPNVIQGCGIRLTDLDQWGIPLNPLIERSRVFTSGFVELSIEPVVFQRAPVPVGGATEGEACIIDNDTPKLTKFGFTLRLCGFPTVVFEKMIGATLLEDPTTVDLFRGLVLKDGHAECCADTLMLEVFAKSADGCDPECAVTQWLFPLTRGWQLTNSFTFQNGETEFTLTGEGEANPNFFPSLPGPTLPSYTTAGVPEGASPPILPVNPATSVAYVPDVLVQADVDEIRAHGPMAVFCLPALPDGIDDCGYMAGLNLPMAVDDTYTTVGTHDVTVNDIAGTFPLDPTSVVFVGLGSFVDNGNGTFTVPPATPPGTYTFTYTINDTQGNTSNVATVTVILAAVVVPPVAVNDGTHFCGENSSCTFSLVVNDIAGTFPIDPTSVVFVSIGPGLSITNNFDGTYTINGTTQIFNRSFTYTVDDTMGNTSNVATVTIFIPPNA